MTFKERIEESDFRIPTRGMYSKGDPDALHSVFQELRSRKAIQKRPQPAGGLSVSELGKIVLPISAATGLGLSLLNN